MTLLLLFSGADFVAAPVTPDAPGLAFLEELSLHAASLEELPLSRSELSEAAIHGSYLDEVR